MAVIFRRGPSKYVEVVRWDLDRDVFERGQWFRGRIYDRRSDLSPDGELLVYFAARYIKPRAGHADALYAWTAVSRPPRLTALALWPKHDAWWGGGLFTGTRRLWLNHPPDQAEPHPQHPPRGLEIETNPEAAGEDEPVYSRRLDREGWVLGRRMEVELSRERGYRTLAPEERVKQAPPDSDGRGMSISLERSVMRFTRQSRFRIHGAANEPELPPGPLDWLDWDSRGRIIALSGGRVWAAHVSDGRVPRFTELIDLRRDEPNIASGDQPLSDAQEIAG